MRKLASYSIEARAAADDGPEAMARAVVQRIDDWLVSKGDPSDDGARLLLKYGRLADLERSQLKTTRGEIFETTPVEHTETGWFRTALCVGHDTERLVVCCDLSAGAQSLMPLWVDVHCPRVVREILALPSE